MDEKTLDEIGQTIGISLTMGLILMGLVVLKIIPDPFKHLIP